MPIKLDTAEARLEEGRSDVTEALAVAVLAADPDDPRAHAVLGRALLCREGPVPQAVAALRAAAQTVDDADVHKDLGIALLRQGETPAARVAFTEALRCRPDHDAAARLAKLTDVLEAGDMAAADLGAAFGTAELLLLARALVVLKRHADAGRVIGVLADAGPLDTDALPTLARSQAGSGELEACLETARELWRRAAHETPFRRRLFAQEVEMLCRALEGAMPDSAARLALLALVLLDAPDRFHEGLAVINQVLSAGSDLADAFLAGGLANFKQGDFAEALRLLDHALALQPGHREAADLRALAKRAAGDSAVSVSGDANGCKLLAEALCASNRADEAGDLLAEGLGAAPLREDMAVLLADIRLLAGRLEDAAGAVAAARAVNPVEPRAGMQQAAVHLSRGELAEGWCHYENRFGY